MTTEQRYEIIKEIAKQINAENESLKDRDRWVESDERKN